LFDHALHQLERRTGKQGVDAALAGEIATKAADRTRQLGLTSGCSGPELYAALIARVQQHDEHLARSIGGNDPTSIPEMVPLIVNAVQAANLPKTGYFLKTEVAERMLRQMPPVAVMERLGYPDVTSLLGRESIFELFLALRFAQDADWLNRFDAAYEQLTADDFETRTIQTIIFDPHKWGDIAAGFIAKKLHNITHSKELGAVGVMPMTASHMTGITLKVMPLLIHYFNEIRLYSAFFKLMKTKRDFGRIVARTLIADTPDIKLTDGQHIHWRVIQRYFGKLKHESHPEVFEPHVQPEDLHWRRAEAVLYDLDPELEFWRDLDYAAVTKQGDVVTFNLMDVSLSYSNQLAYPDRYLYHFRESLWNEIFARYLGQKTLEEQILVRLDNDMIAPEELKLK
ncbi:MAG TPA: hypothetical protein VK963_03935, partial [Candidatus Saccharimonadales bacterium]|nr:hypothetical protein [Candidatus Saccharimonadales bacterium]